VTGLNARCGYRCCYNVPVMKAIRYGLHFPALIVAALVFWFAKDIAFGDRLLGLRFFHYGLMGALHATCIVVSLKDRKATQPIVGFLVYVLFFITLVTLLSAATPLLGLWSSIVWVPFNDILRQFRLGPFVILLDGSVIGSSLYWLLVRVFWLKSLRRADWLRTIALCGAATLLAPLALYMLRGVPKLNVDALSPVLTVSWWFAFSISLFWSETSACANESTQALDAVAQKPMTSLGVTLPECLPRWSSCIPKLIVSRKNCKLSMSW
jgi:hypothetical protein